MRCWDNEQQCNTLINICVLGNTIICFRVCGLTDILQPATFPFFSSQNSLVHIFAVSESNEDAHPDKSDALRPIPESESEEPLSPSPKPEFSGSSHFLWALVFSPAPHPQVPRLLPAAFMHGNDLRPACMCDVPGVKMTLIYMAVMLVHYSDISVLLQFEDWFMEALILFLWFFKMFLNCSVEGVSGEPGSVILLNTGGCSNITLWFN